MDLQNSTKNHAYQLSYFLYKQKDEAKLRDYLERIQQIKNEEDAIDLFKHTTTRKNFHHQNQRPIDKIEFISMFELYDKLIKSLVKQLEKQQEQGDDVEKCREIEQRIADIIHHYTWLLLTGKNRWSEEKLKDFIDIQCSYLVDIFALSSNPAVYFQIYKAIPINDYALEDRNKILAFLSHFDRNIETMKQNLHDYFINCLNISFPVHDNQKIYDEKVEQFLQLIDNDYIQQHSSYSIIRKINQDILKVSKNEQGQQKLQIKLISCLVHYIKLSLSNEFINSPYYSILQCLSLLTQIYNDDKKKYKNQYKSLEYLKIKGEGAKELFEEISQFIEKYKDTSDIQLILDFLANLEYPRLFCSDLLAPIYEKSSLFYKYELFFSQILEDIYEHCNSDTPLKYPLSKVILENPMNLKDFLEISLQNVESLRYLMKTFQSITQIQSQNSSVQRQNLIDLHQKLLNLHKSIFMSFARNEWIFDTAILEIYLVYSSQTFPEFYRFDMQSELQIKVVELIVKYVRKDTMLHCKYKNNLRQVGIDEFFFVIKVYLKIIEENISGEHYEEYLNNLFFNTEELVSYCAGKRNHDGENTISCLLLNICFKQSNVEQMENYFSWKNENKVILFEYCIDLFLKEGIKINPYFDNFITCVTDKIINQNENLRGIYVRMIVKYNFAKIFENSNSQIQLKLKQEGYDIAVQEIKNQIDIQIKNNTKEQEMLKKFFREFKLNENMSNEYSFLFKKIIYWNNLKYERMMFNTKGLLSSLFNYATQEENLQQHFFKIYYEYSLQFVKFITCFTQKNVIGYNFVGINLGQKAVIETLKIQENLIKLFQDQKNNLKQIGKYLLRMNSKEKYIDSLCNDEEEKIHNISQQLIVYLHYLIYSVRDVQLDQEVFVLLVDILISTFAEFLNVKLNDSTETSTASQLDYKIDQIYNKNINIFNKFGQCINLLQKEINNNFYQKLKEKEVTDDDKPLNESESPLIREKFFDIVQFALGACNCIVEQPEYILKSIGLLDKLLLVTAIQHRKTNKVGLNLNERYILMCQSLTRKQNDIIINNYFENILPKFKLITELINGEGKEEERKKYLSYLAQYYMQNNNIFPYQIILNEIFSKENQRGMNKILKQLEEISKLDKQIVKSICKNSEYASKFQKFLSNFSKFDYMEAILKLDVIDKDSFALKIQEEIIEKLEELIQENQLEINSLAQLLKQICQTYAYQSEQQKQNKELILTIVSSMQYIVDENDSSQQDQQDQQQIEQQQNQFKVHLLLLYFIHQVQYNFNEEIEDSLIEKIFQKLINSADKNIPLSVYNIILANPSLMKRISTYSNNKKEYSQQGISLYKRLYNLVNEDSPSSQSSIDKSNGLNKSHPNCLSNYLQLLSQFIDLTSSEDVTYVIQEQLNQQKSDLNDSIFYLLCQSLSLQGNKQFYQDSIICKIAIINQIDHIMKIQEQEKNNRSDDFVLEPHNQNFKELSPSEEVISYKIFLEKYSLYFFAPSYYQQSVNSEEVKQIIQKEKKYEELKQQIDQIKKNKYFKDDDLCIKIMNMIIDNQYSNIKLMHVLINLFPQVIFIFKDKLTDIINAALNTEQSITAASNFIQNVFEIVSIDQEFLDIYKTCLTHKLRDMIKQDSPLMKLIEVAQLIFPMEKKYQRLIMNYLAQQIKFSSDSSKNYSQTNAQRWNLDYFNNVIHYKEAKKESHNILEEANKFIYECLSKNLGELLQNQIAYSQFYKEYQAQKQFIQQDKDKIFEYRSIAIQRDFSQLDNLIESNSITFTQYHNKTSQSTVQLQSSPLKKIEKQKDLSQQLKNDINSFDFNKFLNLDSNEEKKEDKKTPPQKPKKEEKKKESEEEWEDDEEGSDDEDNLETQKDDVDRKDSKDKKQEQEDDEWEDEDYEDSGDENEEGNDVNKKGGQKVKDDDDEDSSDYDHEGEQKQSGKKLKSSPKSPIKADGSENNQDKSKQSTENIVDTVSKDAKEKEYKDGEDQNEADFESDEQDRYQRQEICSDLDSEDGHQEHNDDDDDDEEQDEEEDEEKLNKENEDWNKYLVLKERWSVARYINQDKKEQDAVKQHIFEYLRELKRHKEKIAIFIDVVKQLDEDDLKKYLHTRFPKQITLKSGSNKNRKKKNEAAKTHIKPSQQQKDDDDEFVDDDSEEENKKEKGSNQDKEDANQNEFEEVDENEEDEENEEEDLDEGNLLHISSSEEGLSDDDDDEEENDFDDDDDYDAEHDDNSSLFYNQYGDRSRSHSESSQESNSGDDEDDEHNNDHNSEQNKSLNDRQWSPVALVPPQEKLIQLYMDNLVYYDEKSIENIVKSFYSSSFSNQIISNELLNPIHGPQLMDALFFLLVNPQLYKYEEIKEDKDLDFLVQLGEKQLFLKNYLVLYDNAMSFFRNALCNNLSKQLLSYFTLDALHWSYLPQLSIIKKLKDITNYKQMSGLQALIMLFGDKFKFVDIYENKKQIMVLNQISKFIKSTHIILDPSAQDVPGLAQINIQNPVIQQIDIDNILHYYYFQNEHFNNKGFLFSFLKKGLQKESKYILIIFQQFIESQSKFLIQDVIELMNKGINDVKRILESNEPNTKKFALSHLYEIFSDTEFNPIYDSFKSFAANLRSLMRIYFKKVKKMDKEVQKDEMLKLQEALNNQSLMKLFTQILKQLQYLHANIMAPNNAGSTSVIDNDENGELQQIFQQFIPLVKLMYMLYPYYDLENRNSLEQPEIENADSLPELAKISSKQQSSIKFDQVPSNKLIDIVNEQEDKVLKVEEFKKILEQGFCSIIKLFVGMDDQLFQKYINVVSKDPQNLKSLDLDTRVFAIQAKAVKRAQKEQDCSMEIITLKIDRKCVFEDTFRTIMRQKPYQLVQKQFEVKFRKEDGIDQSGLTREWYSCISKELFDPRKGLFRVASNKYIVYPSTTSYLVPDHITIFRFSGQIIAKSILEGYLIGVDFPKFFLKHLTGSPLKISDLDDIEPELTKNLLWILENPVEDLCLTFIYEYEEMGEKKTVELIPDGKNVDLTDKNKKEYVDKLIDYVMIKQIQPQTKSFLEGFFNIFPKSELFLIDWMELGMKIAGAQEIDFKELRTNTTYQGGYSEISTLIQWFWEILMTFDDKMKRKFLFFLSGSYKIPLGGYKDMGFTISKVFDTQNLPVAHTCFNQLDLPQYEDKETLQKKLYQAILEGNESFGIA